MAANIITTEDLKEFKSELLEDIKEYLGKQSHQFITIDEFSEYTGIKEETIIKYIN